MEDSAQFLAEPVKANLDRVSAQIDGLQQRLDAFIARRPEAIADRASERVASIVAAAEESAAEIRLRAHADAVQIRAEADAEAERAREKAISEASAEIHEVCARLSDELQSSAGAALARIKDRRGSPTAVNGRGRRRANDIAHEAREAVDELQNAATVLEHSLHDLRRGAGEPQRAGAA